MQPDADAAGNLGSTYHLLGRMPEAIEAYEMAVELAPDQQRWKRNLGEAPANPHSARAGVR